MKGKEKQQREMKMSKKNVAASSSSDDEEDSDAERNYALLTARGAEGAEPEVSDEDEEGSDGATEEEEGGEEGSDGHEEPSNNGEEEQEEEGEEEEDGDSGASEDGDAEDAGGSGEIRTADNFKKELSNMSFEDIMKLQSKVGTKVYNKLAYGTSKSPGATRKKRLNKNRPTEVSSKRRAPFLRQVVSVKKPTQRDPRFDDLSGEYKPEIFEKTFKFINNIKLEEREIILKKLKKSKNSENKEKLKFLLKRMDNQERARQSREEQRESELRFKREQRERASQGERPYFLKNSEKKKLQLAEKFQELKKSGKLENFLSKKRKRNAGKDRRKLPRQLLDSSSQ